MIIFYCYTAPAGNSNTFKDQRAFNCFFFFYREKRTSKRYYFRTVLFLYRSVTETSYCYTTPCKNGGTCTETDTGFECICPSQWNCIDCSCNGKSRHSPQQSRIWIDLVSCQLSDPYYDIYFPAAIKHSLDNCSPNPCHNGGSCFSTHDGFKCLCRQGYKGKACESNIITHCHIFVIYWWQFGWAYTSLIFCLCLAKVVNEIN